MTRSFWFFFFSSRYNKVYEKHLTVCHRTICPGNTLVCSLGFLLPVMLLYGIDQHTSCHLISSSSSLDPCDSQPCLNGGTCVSEGAEGYHCVCPPGYGGDPHCGQYALLLHVKAMSNIIKLTGPLHPSSAPALSLDCSIELLFLLEGSAKLTLEGFLRLKSFLKRFLQTVIGSGSPTKVGLAVFGGDTRVEAQIGKFRGNLRALLKAVDALQPVGGQTLTGQAIRYVTRHGFVTEPAFADVSDDLPRVVVLLTDTPADDEVVEASKYAHDREIFLIGVGPDVLKGQLNNITGNPQRTLTYTSPDRLAGKIPELKAKICSVDTQGTDSSAHSMLQSRAINRIQTHL